MQRGRFDSKKHKDVTYTPISSDMHDAVKAYAAFNSLRIPQAYAKIISEGLKTLGFEYQNLVIKK